MNLTVVNKITLENQVLSYLEDECSFYMEPLAYKIDFALQFNRISLSVASNQIVHVSGFSGFLEWMPTVANVPESKKGVIIVEHSYQRGVAYAIGEDLPTHINKTKGWVCIGDPYARGESVEFIVNCIAVIKSNKLIALWLKPTALPTLFGRHSH